LLQASQAKPNEVSYLTSPGKHQPTPANPQVGICTSDPNAQQPAPKSNNLL